MTKRCGNGRPSMYSIVWATLGVLMLTGSVKASEPNVVDGDTGILYVSGVITRSACNLDSDSRRQSIDLGTVGTGELQHAGDRGAGTVFHLHLHDCFDSEVTARDTRTGNEQISDGLPSVRVSFMSTADVASPQLIAVRGATGMGLRLEDARHRQVRVNEGSEPLRVASGEPVLTYYLVPERTRQPLNVGVWQGMVYIRFSYD